MFVSCFSSLKSQVPAPRESGSAKEWCSVGKLRQRWNGERAGFERFQGAAILTKKSPLAENAELLKLIAAVPVKDETELATRITSRTLK